MQHPPLQVGANHLADFISTDKPELSQANRRALELERTAWARVVAKVDGPARGPPGTCRPSRPTPNEASCLTQSPTRASECSASFVRGAASSLWRKLEIDDPGVLDNIDTPEDLDALSAT